MAYEIKQQQPSIAHLAKKLSDQLNEMETVCSDSEINRFYAGLVVGRMIEIVDQLDEIASQEHVKCES